MTPLFVDTYYYLALLSRDDEAHARAVDLSRSLSVPLLTTGWVLTEVGDALSAPGRREAFLVLLDTLRSDPDVTILPASADLFDRGVDLFRRRPDKDWTLTDCISFVVMESQGVSQALTGDRHFVQAGFQALMLPQA